MKGKTQKSVPAAALVSFLDRELQIGRLEDYSRNGLQVQGATMVSNMGLAVDACMATYKAASARGCQMVIVHHGMIWGGIAYVTGATFRQLKFLFDHGMSLYAAHLPLDLHPRLGNNVQIARMLGLRSLRPFGCYKGTMIGYEGELPRPAARTTLSDKLARLLGARTVVLPFGTDKIRRVAIVSGSASDIIREAIQKNVDCFISGEPEHSHHHCAREAGLNVIYCGHYHSEKPGVIAVGRLIAKRFGIACDFLDVPTIV
ncbi:MAG: Nif3-like dinuclear metal center hexameric protein [Chitinispirillaceae bacterium]|nr:Nif3-like dinuclear metal center hexameric protein [Chitinispirillaceae bacterium]